ncbi:hypothetical protein F5Y19DRAFT_136947 [Xylariaceae sp. FL1651]|nr:hypothetical protein F5Y19DRAFT_136947 [Xylariaceae sp. FL1651]
MDSPQVESFHKSWKVQKRLMEERHDNERLHYRRERDNRKQTAKEDAERELNNLRATVPAAEFDAEVRRVHQGRDDILASIQTEYDKRIHLIKEAQRTEQMSHEIAYRNAIAARFFGNDPSPTHLTATSTADTDGLRPASREPSPSSASRSPSPHSHDHMRVVEDAKLTLAASQECGEVEIPHKTPFCTVHPLQEATETHQKPQFPRTITFDEVYRNGQATHKDTIVEYPSGSGQWFILKCEEHQMRFNERPLQGAAKHLNGKRHGFEDRKRELAVQRLGYLVVDCNAQLAELNNKAVAEAVANGYKPVGHSRNRVAQKKARVAVASSSPDDSAVTNVTRNVSGRSNQEEGALETVKRKGTTPSASIYRESALSSCERTPRTSLDNSTEMIVDPKIFHIYYAYWKPADRVWPVMVLGWDDQTAGGLKGDLFGTGLLNKKPKPPTCYIYKDGTMNNATNNAIIGWAAGFEDGGPKVKQRKFPVMFFDENQSVSWISAQDLSKFPLYEPNPPEEDDHPFNAARRWVAKKEGFPSWEEFEKIRNAKDPDKVAGPVPTPAISLAASVDRSNCGSDAGSSARSVASNLTENELLELQDRAGETASDEDYSGSDIDSTLEAECEGWGRLEPSDGRPWAFYGLRSMEDKQPAASRPSNLLSTESVNTAENSSVEEVMRSARSHSVGAFTQDALHLAEAGYDTAILSTLSTESQILKEPEGEAKQVDNSETPVSTPSSNHRDSSISKRTNHSPQYTVFSAHIDQGVEDCSINEDFSFILRTSRNLLNGSMPPLAVSEKTSKGTKRARTEDNDRTGLTLPMLEPVKKAKVDTRWEVIENEESLYAKGKSSSWSENDAAMVDTLENQVIDMPAAPEAASAPTISTVPFMPTGPAIFELSSYSKGSVSWSREGEESCVRLYYGEDEKTLVTADSPDGPVCPVRPVHIKIEPTALAGFLREIIPGSNGNSTMTLLSKEDGDAPEKLVFGRAKGSKVDIGKIQVRSFIRWLRNINPGIRCLGG